MTNKYRADRDSYGTKGGENYTIKKSKSEFLKNYGSSK